MALAGRNREFHHGIAGPIWDRTSGVFKCLRWRCRWLRRLYLPSQKRVSGWVKELEV
jgi:hypothetical protein